MLDAKLGQAITQRFCSKQIMRMFAKASERLAKALAIGRGNWIFCPFPKGAEATAIKYTLVETAKANGADVYYYLKYCKRLIWLYEYLWPL